MRRKCKQCRSWKTNVEWPTTAGLVCRDCAQFLGVGGGSGGMRNVAEKNSKDYRDNKLCKGRHNIVDVSRYRKNGKDWEKGTCRRCKTVVYDAKF